MHHHYSISILNLTIYCPYQQVSYFHVFRFLFNKLLYPFLKHPLAFPVGHVSGVKFSQLLCAGKIFLLHFLRQSFSQYSWLAGAFFLLLSVLLFIFLFLFFVFLLFLGPLLQHMEVPRLGGPIGAIATGLRQSHSNAGDEPHLQPTPQLTAKPDR